MFLCLWLIHHSTTRPPCHYWTLYINTALILRWSRLCRSTLYLYINMNHSNQTNTNHPYPWCWRCDQNWDNFIFHILWETAVSGLITITASTRLQTGEVRQNQNNISVLAWPPHYTVFPPVSALPEENKMLWNFLRHVSLVIATTMGTKYCLSYLSPGNLINYCKIPSLSKKELVPLPRSGKIDCHVTFYDLFDWFPKLKFTKSST